MNVHDYRFLLSERATLNKFLSRIPTEQVITRESFAHRLSQVEAELEAYKGMSPRVPEALLTFRGKPVSGSRGMSSRFFSDALSNFATATHYVGASQRLPALPPIGTVRYAEDYELLITGTVHGSFGFKVEQASQQLALEGEYTPVEIAFKKVKSILEASIDTDARLTAAIGKTDARALDAIEKFLRGVADNDAVCALEFRRDIFRFDDPEQVRRSADRLIQDKVKEGDVNLTGQFQGFLPKSRRAEFLVEEADADFVGGIAGEVIAFSVEPVYEDAIPINSILGKDAHVKAKARRTGSRQPQFTATEWGLVG